MIKANLVKAGDAKLLAYVVPRRHTVAELPLWTSTEFRERPLNPGIIQRGIT